MLVSILHAQGKPSEMMPKEFNTKYLQMCSFFSIMITYAMCVQDGELAQKDFLGAPAK